MNWKNMTVGKKLSLGFGLVLVLFAIVSGFCYLRFQVVDHLAHEVSEHTEENAFLLEKEIDHLKWMARLSDLFLKEEVTSVQVQTDDHKCGFGKWLYGEETQGIAEENKEIASLLDSIKEPHRKLHESAEKIGKTYVAFDRSLDALLAERWIDHLFWIKNLSTALLTGNEFNGGLDPQGCAFGKWYYTYKASDPKFGTLLKEWEEPHGRLHYSAQKIVEAMKKSDQDLARSTYQEETLPALDKLAACYEKTMGWVDETIEKQEVARTVFDTETEPAVIATQQILAKMRESFHRQADTTNEQMNRGIDNAMLLVAVVSTIAIVLGILAAVFIIQGITKPITRVIADLNEGAAQLASASGQISSASQSLAEGSSEQAASLEETSSSLEEMSSMTKQNAENASQADNLMNEANQVINTANNSMTELTTSMVEISKASEETSKIIRTIDEIAFQTNLLALNAAVEAARAGEAGAGFAVVADEVRNLAMRAADAAKNTAALIEGTVKKVKDGSELVTSTNEAFTEVATNASKVGELVGEIAVASNEQAQGIEQVNRAVTEMDTVVQATAANAEESASASEEMNAQAEQMKGVVGDLVAIVGGSATNGKAKDADTFKAVATSAGNLLRKAVTSPRKEATTHGVAISRSKKVRPEQVLPMDESEFKDF